MPAFGEPHPSAASWSTLAAMARAPRALLLALSLVVIAATPIVGVRPASAQTSVTPGTHRGVVRLIDTGRSELELETGGRVRRARYAPLTLVTIDGMPGAVTDLRPGMQVTVRYRMSESGRESTDLVAIEAHR